MSVLANLAVTLGMLLIVPFGLALIDAPGLALVRRWWPVPAVLGAVTLWLPRGDLSVGLACVYAVAAVALVVVAVARLVQRRSLAPREIAVLTALVCPSIAALALVAERGGHTLFGFDLDILELTVPHFHYAGFAAALIAGLVSRATAGSGTLSTVAALSVPAGTGLVLVGYFINDWVELAGGTVLTIGMWSVGWLVWTQLRTHAKQRPTQLLLAVSSVTLVATMLLAVSYAFGEAADLPHLSLTWMVATHGAANAVGFALCGLLAFRRLAPARI